MNASNQQLVLSGQAVRVRPMRLRSKKMEAEVLRRLSPASSHYRFIGGTKPLTPEALRALSYDPSRHSMGFVATVSDDDREIEVGVSRYAPDIGTDVHEMVVSVADNWQSEGVGTRLTQKLIEFARDRGAKKLSAIAFDDDPVMQETAAALKIQRQRDRADARHVIYALTVYT